MACFFRCHKDGGVPTRATPVKSSRGGAATPYSVNDPLPAGYLEAALRRQFCKRSWAVVYKDIPRLSDRIEVDTTPALDTGTPPIVVRFSVPPPPCGAVDAVVLSDEAGDESSSEGDYTNITHCRRRIAQRESGIYECAADLTDPTTTSESAVTVDDPAVVPACAENPMVQTLCRIVARISTVSESPAVAAEIGRQLGEFRRIHANTTLPGEMLTQELFENFIGHTCRTSKILRMVNQAVIFDAMYMLKTSAATRDAFSACKDIRERRGWRVVIHTDGPDRAVSITHIRREMCGSPTLPTDARFEVEWSLRLMFDPAMQDTTAVDLRVTSVSYGAAMETSTRTEIDRNLCGGKLILAC